MLTLFLSDLVEALNIGWKGMVALFIAMFFIWLAIQILNKVKK